MRRIQVASVKLASVELAGIDGLVAGVDRLVYDYVPWHATVVAWQQSLLPAQATFSSPCCAAASSAEAPPVESATDNFTFGALADAWKS